MVLGSICFFVNGGQGVLCVYTLISCRTHKVQGLQRVGDTVSRSDRMATFARSHAKVTEHNRKSDRILSSN